MAKLFTRMVREKHFAPIRRCAMKTLLAVLAVVIALSVLAWQFLIGPMFVQSMKPPPPLAPVSIPNPLPVVGSAHEVLSKSAKDHGYYTYMTEVAVPYASFPAARLSEWKRESDEETLAVTANGIERISVDFSNDGTEIYGVIIDWKRSRSTVFPYHLKEERTMDFVQKAIHEMDKSGNKGT
jgi:hypothetical protein